MIDSRLKALPHAGELLARCSRERVLIENFDCPEELSEQLIRRCSRGRRAVLRSRSARVQRALLKRHRADRGHDALRRGDDAGHGGLRRVPRRADTSELSDVDEDKLTLYRSIYSRRVHHEPRVRRPNGGAALPNGSMAQLAGMSTEQFEDFTLTCNLDYSKMDKAMDDAGEVEIGGQSAHRPGHDLAFSVKGIPSSARAI